MIVFFNLIAYVYIVRVLTFAVCYGVPHKASSDFLFIIEKLSENRVNLTCFVYGNAANSAVFLSAQNDLENINNETNVSDNDILLIPLNKEKIYLDLPAVLDKQWETFPWHTINEAIRLRSGEYKWVSVKQTPSLYICVYSAKCIYIKNNSQDVWRHIQLHYNGSHLIVNGHIQQTINIEKSKYFIDIKLDANYRTHDYTVLQHNNKTEFNFSIENLQWSFIQISFLICNGCKIYIKFETQDGERISDVYKFDNINNDFHWNTYVLKNKNLNARSNIIDSKITLVANLETPSSINLKFMVLRNLLVGYEERNHYISRIVSLRNLHQYSCQIIDPFTAILNAPVNTTKNIIHNIKKSKICDQYSCYCSLGSTGNLCDRNCDIGYWDDCKTICDCCDKFNSCDPFTGICLYPQSDCSKSRSVRNINVLAKTAKKITAEVLIDKENLQEKINIIRIEYRNKEAITTTHNLSLDGDVDYFELINLAPSMIYEIAATLCMDEVCFNDNTLRIKVTTRCNAPLESEYSINTTNSKIVLNLSKQYADGKGSCAKMCGIYLKGPEIIRKDIQSKIAGLQPDTLYNVSIWCDGVKINSKSIRTAANVLGEVRNLRLLNNTVSWNAPNEDSNLTSNYDVYITRTGSILCDTALISSKLKLNLTEFILPKLEVFSTYAIHVQACNEKGCGQNKTLRYSTPPSDELSQNEKPKIFYLNNMKYIIEFDNCDALKAPFVNFTIDFACLDNWCNDSQRITDEFTLNFKKNTTYYQHPIKEGLLIPYTKYETNWKIHRNKQQFLVGTGEIRTFEACPPAVRDLTIYSRSNTSISLRWKKPFPPHGILKKYTFSYSYRINSFYYDKDANDIRKCDLWDDANYFCWTVEDLEMKPSLIITASNEYTSNCNTGVYLTSIKLEESASDPPQNISIQWTNTNMTELLIKWKHPNKSNGRIKFFKLIFTDVMQNITLIENITVHKEAAYYSFIWTNFNESSKYNLSAIPMNQFEGASANFETLIITPPPFPEMKENINCTVIGNSCSLDIPIVYNMLRNSSSIVVLLHGSKCLKSTLDYEKYLKERNLMYLEQNSDNICTYQLLEYHENNSILLNFVDYPDFTSFKDLIHDENFKIEVLFINSFGQYTRMSKYSAHLSGISSPGYKRNQLKESISPFDLTQINYWYFSIFTLFILSVTTIVSVWLRIRKRTSKPFFDLAYTRNGDETSALVPTSNIIKQIDFGQYMFAAIENGDLYEEYNSVPVQFSNTSALKIKNGIKKEINNNLEWHTIDGYKCPGAYITMQNPSADSVAAFWKMIFDNKIRLIVMLNDGEDYYIYWPNNEERKITSEEIEITLEAEFHHGNYIERSLRISDGFIHYELKQLQYETWPQFNIPEHQISLCAFLEKFHNFHIYENPAVIHSSIGVGRTGTLILSDYILQMEKDVAIVDFLLVLNNLRRVMSHFVQTQEQYLLAHVLVHDYLFIQKSRLICNDSFEHSLKSILSTDEIITEQFEYLQRMKDIDSIHQDEQIADELNTDYISVNTFKNDKVFVTRQTIGQFWENIVETNCSVLIVLEKLEFTLYPMETDNKLKINDNISIHVCNSTYFGLYNKLEIKLKRQIPYKEHCLEIVQIQDSSMDQNILTFIQFYQDIKWNYTNNNIPTVITCINGFKFSGLFIAYHFVIKKLLTDQICDVISVIRDIRYKNRNFICNTQLKFIYSAVLGAMDMFKLYHGYDTIGLP